MKDNKLVELRNIIRVTLDPIFKDTPKVHLCCLQGKRNAGDGFISLGELDYFDELCILHNDYYIWDTNLIDIGPNDLIVFSGGGGNLSIWNQIRAEYIKILNKYPDNKVVFMPYSDPFTADVSIFDQDRIIHILRDKSSYDLARSRYNNSRILLCPDIAMYMNMSRFSTPKVIKDTLLIKRTDKESIEYPDLKVDTQDWITMDEDKRQHRLSTPKETFVASTQKVINQLSEYKHIISTRLHAVILCYLLGTEVTYMDNNYGKLTNYISTWKLPINRI